MSMYLQQEFDFIQRTKIIIEQYDEHFCNKNTDMKFDVTLLLNCMVGLLILPHTYWFGYLPKELISKAQWGIHPDNISFIKIGETKSVDEVTRHLRNSLSHYRFQVFKDENNEINEIYFEDRDEKEKTFEANIPISGIKIFMDKFSQWVLDEMKEEKQPLIDNSKFFDPSI